MKYLLMLIVVLFSLIANAQPGDEPNSFSIIGGITGRRVVSYPNPKAEFNDTGRVTIKIWVNRDGMIIRHDVQSAKNATLRAIAEQKIVSVRFNKNKEAPVEQSGILIFNFKAIRKAHGRLDLDYRQKYYDLLEDYKRLSDEHRKLLENNKALSN